MTYEISDFKDGEILIITNIIRDYFDQTMSIDTLHEFITSEIFYKHLVEERKTFNECSTDTACRDLLADALSQFICGMNWPLYGDVAKYKEDWRRRFTREAKKLGIKEV